MLNTRKYNDNQAWINDSYSLNHREIYISEDIDGASVPFYIRVFKEMERKNSQPITIYISTYGGDIYHALGLYDIIVKSPCFIKTIGIGPIMSAGLLLLLSGDYRDITENSRIMAHEVSEHGAWDSRTTSQTENDLEAQKDIENAMVAKLALKTGKTAAFWKKTIKHRDVYIDRKKALKWNIITSGEESEE